MTALEQALARLVHARAAVSEADLERADLLLAELEDDLRRADLLAVARGHACPICATDCDSASALRVYVKALQDALLVLAYALRESREFRDVARAAIDERFPAEAA